MKIRKLEKADYDIVEDKRHIAFAAVDEIFVRKEQRRKGIAFFMLVLAVMCKTLLNQ